MSNCCLNSRHSFLKSSHFSFDFAEIAYMAKSHHIYLFSSVDETQNIQKTVTEKKTRASLKRLLGEVLMWTHDDID